MSLWEYKVITSGKGGFARPDLMEKFLNDLGRDEWEIIQFHSHPDNFMVFTGLARRSTQRDWTLQDAAAAAAKAEAEKLRAEFEAKFKAANQPAAAPGEERAPSFLEEKAAPDDGFRKPVDTSRDDEPEAAEDEKDDWDKLTAAEEDELPTFFEAIKPHMRRNQRGPGMSVGVDYLAKKWDQTEEDLKGALVECGFVMPTDEDSKAEYLEYDGDLYWLNINRRGELWINTKEKPRPVFRPVKAARIEIEAPAPKQGSESTEKSEAGERKGAANESSATKPESVSESEATPADTTSPEAQSGKPQQAAQPLPSGAALLDKIRPHMRRNRRGPGGSGSTSFLSRALRTNEAELRTAFAALGLTIPTAPADKPVYTEFGNELWWLNLDSRGGLWINGREKKHGETAAAASAAGASPAGADGTAPTEGVSGETAAVEPAAVDAVPAPEVAPNASISTNDTATASAPAAHTAAPESSTMGSAAVDAAATEQTREVAPVPAVDVSPASAPASNADAPIPASAAAETSSSSGSVLTALRLLLKETKTGAIAAKTDRLADELGKSADDLIATLMGAGLKVPEKPREKPVFVEHAGEIFWLNKNARGELWLNAKASKFADPDEADAESEDGEENGEGAESAGDAAEGDGEKKPRRGGRSRSKKSE